MDTMDEPMKIAFSPCPNDTFIFHALVHGLISNTPEFEVTFADIDVTNRLAVQPNELDVMKISYAALPYVLGDYRLIACGGALGRGCGPLVLTNDLSIDPEQLIGKKVAVPSDRSTAYMLFRLWVEQRVPGPIGEVVVMPFEQIMPAVRTGDVDAGLVIHEARFTYHQYGLRQLVDLGEWWEEDTGLPIPLGAIIAKRTLSSERMEQLTEWIRASVQYAWDHPEASAAYVQAHAQEMSAEVTQAHISLYVNEFSSHLGEDGYQAIESLLGRAAKQGIVPAIDSSLLRS